MSGIKRKIAKHVPGFREGKYWHQFLALIAYLSMAMILISAFQQSVIWGGVSLAIFLFSVAFIFDVGGMWQVLRLPKHDQLLKFFILLVYLCLVSTILYVFSPNSVIITPRNQFQVQPPAQDFPAP